MLAMRSKGSKSAARNSMYSGGDPYMETMSVRVETGETWTVLRVAHIFMSDGGNTANANVVLQVDALVSLVH